MLRRLVKFVKENTGVIQVIIGILALVVTIILFVLSQPCGEDDDSPTDISVTASAHPPDPPQYGKVTIRISVTDEKGNPVSGAAVKTLAHYRTTTTEKTGASGADGLCEIVYHISGATPGYKVNVEIHASYQEKNDYTFSSFTPR